MEEIRTMSGMDLAELRDVAEDRDLWRRTVARIQRWHKGFRVVCQANIIETSE